MSKIKATLTLTLHLEDESETMSFEDMMTETKANLDQLVNRAASEGMFTYDSPMMVETFSHTIYI